MAMRAVASASMRFGDLTRKLVLETAQMGEPRNAQPGAYPTLLGTCRVRQQLVEQPPARLDFQTERGAFQHDLSLFDLRQPLPLVALTRPDKTTNDHADHQIGQQEPIGDLSAPEIAHTAD